MTKKVIEQIPILTGLIFIVGIIKLTLYYENFDLSIKYFIGVTEIAQTVTDHLLFLLLMYFVMKGIEISLKDAETRFMLFSSTGALNIIISILFVLINALLVVSQFVKLEYYERIFYSSLSFFFLFTTVMQTKWGLTFKENNREAFFFVQYFLLATLFIVAITSRELKEVVNGKYIGTRIVANDTTFLSSDTSYYIGHTDKYLFIYHTSKHCIILPTTLVKEIDLYIRKED